MASLDRREPWRCVTATSPASSIGDVHLTIADEVLKTPIGKAFPTAEEKLSALV
jgi:hypothetical protein